VNRNREREREGGEMLASNFHRKRKKLFWRDKLAAREAGSKLGLEQIGDVKCRNEEERGTVFKYANMKLRGVKIGFVLHFLPQRGAAFVPRVYHVVYHDSVSRFIPFPAAILHAQGRKRERYHTSIYDRSDFNLF